MYQRKLASFSAAFVGGAAAAEYGLLPFFYGIFIPALACFAVLAGRREKPPSCSVRCFLAVLAAAAFCGSGLGTARRAYTAACESRLDGGGECLLLGTVYSKQQDTGSFRYYLKKCRVRQNGTEYPCGNVLVYLEISDYSIGEILLLNADVRLFSRARNEGGYDERSYYHSLNILCAAYAKKADAVYGRPDAFREWLYAVKEKWKESYGSAMPKADAGILTAMVLGDKSSLDADRKQLYQNAGISHFYSISGLHISMLGMACYVFLKKRGIPCTVSCVLASAWILGYGQLIGFGISASRAIGMFLLQMYAKCRSRSYDAPTALAFLAALLTARNPAVLRNAGFLLSFGAVAGVLAAGYLQELFGSQREPVRAGIRAGIFEALLVSACIQIMTIPVVCGFFYEVSVYAAVVNLLVLPCMGVLLGIGILGGVTGCLFPFAGRLMLYPCHLLFLLLETACGAVLSLPGAVLITGRPSPALIVLWYGCIVLGMILVGSGMRVREAVCGLPPVFFPLFFFALLLAVRSVPGFEINLLDVGQGDGICIFPGDGTALLIDGGSTDVKNAGTYRILPFLKCRGIRRVDYWFVSHCDADHINGLCELMEAGYPIKHLVVSEYMPDDTASCRLKKLASRHGIPVLKMGEGDAVKGKKGGWAIRSLSQKADAAQGDRNAASLVLLYESPACRAFFGGDIGTEQEERLLAQGALKKTEIYKASHHGSDTSNGSKMLQALKPDIAVISCGRYNSYGHPGKRAVRNMKQAGAEVYETKEGGQVKISDKGVRQIFP